MSFSRTAAGAEIDMVLEGRRGDWYAVEIKRSTAPTVSKGFWIGRDDLGAASALVIYPWRERIPLGEGAEALGLRDALWWVRDRVKL